ncbi:hypothetical protein DPMN_009577 [Dreissena polymorpha]|uniref:Carbonic anhydrase n=1 Tax=Dreissena polymorpha TaxID=45954 RepID=A0A9D4N2F9_DREPO|nr:hypothetical protein DPMN_009577 [Dreissena polymorpha]
MSNLCSVLEDVCQCPKILARVCGQLGEAVTWYGNAREATCANPIILMNDQCEDQLHFNCSKRLAWIADMRCRLTSEVLRLALLLLLVRPSGGSTLYQWLVDSQTRFNYDPDPDDRLGVYNWPRTYPGECGGDHQSPVDIKTDRVRYKPTAFRCPKIMYNHPVLKGRLKNNGHTAEFEPEREDLFQLCDVPYRHGRYRLHDFHLHYGGVTGRDFELQGRRFRGSGVMSAGSEHTVDGLRFEGEVHFVLYNCKYENLEQADSKPDGVVVLVALIQKLLGNLTNRQDTSEFSEFLERNIPRISPYQSNISTDVDLNIFFNRKCEFYTYAGSSTTPPCHQSVRWIIFKEPVMVTELAWFTLTGLQSRGDFNSRFGNYRTTQPINNRVIEANFRPQNGPIRPSPNAEIIAMVADPRMLSPPETSARVPGVMAIRMSDVDPGNTTRNVGMETGSRITETGLMTSNDGEIIRSNVPISDFALSSGNSLPMSTQMTIPTFNSNEQRVIQSFRMRPRSPTNTVSAQVPKSGSASGSMGASAMTRMKMGAVMMQTPNAMFQTISAEPGMRTSSALGMVGFMAETSGLQRTMGMNPAIIMLMAP